jgi:hypothetical protein
MFTLFALIIASISFSVAFPVFKKMEAEKSNDTMGYKTFQGFLKAAGPIRTIIVYGGISVAMAMFLLPTIMEVINNPIN